MGGFTVFTRIRYFLAAFRLLHVPMQIRLSLALSEPAHFRPLGRTPFRDSRCTFRFRGLAQGYPVWTFPEFTRFAE
jgi:hypothetical protein